MKEDNNGDRVPIKTIDEQLFSYYTHLLLTTVNDGYIYANQIEQWRLLNGFIKKRLKQSIDF